MFAGMEVLPDELATQPPLPPPPRILQPNQYQGQCSELLTSLLHCGCQTKNPQRPDFFNFNKYIDYHYLDNSWFYRKLQERSSFRLKASYLLSDRYDASTSRGEINAHSTHTVVHAWRYQQISHKLSDQ